MTQRMIWLAEVRTMSGSCFRRAAFDTRVSARAWALFTIDNAPHGSRLSPHFVEVPLMGPWGRGGDLSRFETGPHSSDDTQDVEGLGRLYRFPMRNAPKED